MTILILVGGVAMIVALMGEGERARRGAMEGVTLGEPAERVTELLGAEPLVCPAESLDHLRSSFPEGWPPAAVDVAIEKLEQSTAERWLFELDGSVPEMCAPLRRRTEIGVDAAGEVVWTVALLGRSPLRLPAALTPSGVVNDGDPSR